jgi:hypothetical protein
MAKDDCELTNREGWVTVRGGGETVQLYPNADKSLLSVIRENASWGKVFDAVAPMPGAQELMIDCAVAHFDTVAADTIRKLDIAGLDLDAMVDKTGMSPDCINRRLNDLFHAQHKLHTQEPPPKED